METEVWILKILEMFPVDPGLLGEMWGLHSHCPWEKAMGSALIYSIPGVFPVGSKSFLGIGSLQIRRWFSPAIRLGNRWCNQQRAISGSYKHKQSDSTHLGSWQPNELPAEAHSSTAATHHRPRNPRCCSRGFLLPLGKALHSAVSRILRC